VYGPGTLRDGIGIRVMDPASGVWTPEHGDDG